jgi:hypothetical protein
VMFHSYVSLPEGNNGLIVVNNGYSWLIHDDLFVINDEDL